MGHQTERSGTKNIIGALLKNEGWAPPSPPHIPLPPLGNVPTNVLYCKTLVFNHVILFCRRLVTASPSPRRTTQSSRPTPPRTWSVNFLHNNNNIRFSDVRRLNRLIWIFRLSSLNRVWRNPWLPSIWSRRSMNRPRLLRISKNLEPLIILSGNNFINKIKNDWRN